MSVHEAHGSVYQSDFLFWNPSDRDHVITWDTCSFGDSHVAGDAVALAHRLVIIVAWNVLVSLLAF